MRDPVRSGKTRWWDSLKSGLVDHETLKITPAMAAEVTPKPWEMSDMVKALEEWEAEGNS
jgi:hypothetical protein